jgi:hypothetical protein
MSTSYLFNRRGNNQVWRAIVLSSRIPGSHKFNQCQLLLLLILRAL